MKRASTSGSGEPPDVGPATPRVVKLFELALEGKQDLQRKIEDLAAKSHPSVRDVLELCFLRNELSLIDPPLPDTNLSTAIRLWRYWIDHTGELRRYESLHDDILSYLIPPNELKERANRSKADLLELVAPDKVTLLAFYPIVEALSAPRGRPVSRRPIAVKALQMKLDTNRSWREITDVVCDCGKSKHNSSCVQIARQGVIALKRLLRQHGVAVHEAGLEVARH